MLVPFFQKVSSSKSLFFLRRKGLAVDFSVVTKYAVENLKGQIPSPALSFDLFEKSHSLNIMKKMPDTIILRQLRENFLPIMAKRGMTDIMAEGDGFDEVFIEPKKASNGPGNL